MKIDLHTHTCFSDGKLDPESLVSLARARGVNLLSITDHDCLDGLPAAERIAKSCGIGVVPGVELNTDWKGGEVHILGYGFDPGNEALQEKLREQRDHRSSRLKAMLAKLLEIGLELDEKRVDEIAGKGSVGRPHLALALIEKSYVSTVDEAFLKFLGFGKPGWVPRSKFTPKEAIESISAAGGLPVLAHPGRAGSFSLEELVGYGLKGIEVFYPSHEPDLVEKLLSDARKHRLLVTGGSDYHGINPWEEGPGCVEVPEKFGREIRTRFEAMSAQAKGYAETEL